MQRRSARRISLRIFMAYDGFFTGIIARRLDRELRGGRIEKVYQPHRDEIILQIGTPRERKRLLLNTSAAGCRVHISNQDFENPENAPAFCMLLRKHLVGGRIISISQPLTERIIHIEIGTVNELGFKAGRKLIAEIMGKHSNLILADTAEGNVIDSIKRVTFNVNRFRQILPGLPYTPPPAQDKADFWTLTKEDLEIRMERLGGREDSAEIALKCVQGVGPTLAEELAFAAGGEAGRLYDAIEAARRVAAAEDARGGFVYIAGGNKSKTSTESGDSAEPASPAGSAEPVEPKEFHAIRLRHLEGAYEEIAFQDLGDMLDFFYSARESTSRFLQRVNELKRVADSALSKLLLKKQRLLEDLRAAEEADRYRIYGEILTASIHLIPPKSTEATLKNYYDDTDLKIELDPLLSPAQNAQRYFKKYSKAKTAKKEKIPQLTATDADIDYLKSVLASIENSETMEELEFISSELAEAGLLREKKHRSGRRKAIKIAPRKYILASGLSVLIGRNNKENDRLTFKLASKGDIWFHTKDIHGSHAVLFTEGKEASEEDLKEAAALAAYYSRGRNSDNVPVDYTDARYVKKPSGAKPGMVIYTNHKTLYVTPKKP